MVTQEHSGNPTAQPHTVGEEARGEDPTELTDAKHEDFG